MAEYLTREIGGWGNYPRVESRVFRVETLRGVKRLLSAGAEDKLIPRGEGRSYGDPAISRDGPVVDMRRLDRFLSFDSAMGTLECEAGVSLAEILRYFVPRGWFPSVTPGTKYVSVGGALAADVHGKNHHRGGSFSNHVESFRILPAGEEEVVCSRDSNPDLFWATLGGMGLTGIITSAKFRLRPIKSSLVDVTVRRVAHIEEALDAFHELDEQYEYSAAWLDGFARGRRLGRSVLLFGNHSEEGPLESGKGALLDIPCFMPSVLLNRTAVRAFNSLYFNRHPKEFRQTAVHYDSFFYPLDRLGDWNRLYGKRGFLQYQVVVPEPSGRKFLNRILETLCEHRLEPYLVVLKRFGEQEGMLSFPMSGYTLALDFPVSQPLLELLKRFDEELVDAGGRLYLAKDSRMAAGLLEQMYPRFREWQRIKRQVDPRNVFQSEQSNRLCINS